MTLVALVEQSLKGSFHVNGIGQWYVKILNTAEMWDVNRPKEVFVVVVVLLCFALENKPCFNNIFSLYQHYQICRLLCS